MNYPVCYFQNKKIKPSRKEVIKMDEVTKEEDEETKEMKRFFLLLLKTIVKF